MIHLIIPKLPFINKQETIDFYVRHFGFKAGGDYGDYVLLHLDTLELHLFAYPTLDPAKSDFMIYLRVDRDIEQLYNKLAKNNVPNLRKLETRPWGQKEFSLNDPNGTLLTFGQAEQ
jgi:uncharacterized glyoxalase superfamily protein PhnB